MSDPVRVQVSKDALLDVLTAAQECAEDLIRAVDERYDDPITESQRRCMFRDTKIATDLIHTVRNLSRKITLEDDDAEKH